VSARGYSLLEMVITMAIVSVAAAGAFRLIDAAHRLSFVGGEAADMTARLRVAGATMQAELLRAGANAANDVTGTFSRGLPAVTPWIPGDAIGRRRNDGITVVYVRQGAAQTTTAVTLTDVSGGFTVNTDPGCPEGQPACGLRAGDTVAVYDATGDAGFFSITSVTGAGGVMTAVDAPAGVVFPAGSSLVAVERRSYFLKPDASGRPFQLAASSGAAPAIPVVDDVVALTFDYFDDAGAAAPIPLAAVDPFHVRAVAVTVRVDAVSDALRGRAPTLFARPGTAPDPARSLPDVEQHLRVSLRNTWSAE
jgi:prepilin-type N-terminal cleavage/methylation domain-containing protein